MALSEQQLVDLYYKAVSMLESKLSHIPEQVFATGRKPSISDILTNNQDAFYVTNIPPEFQLPFVFEQYEHFVNARFRVNKKYGNPAINKAIFYWRMDNTHSFSRRHPRVAYNILAAGIICASPTAYDYVNGEAYAFCHALIDAWAESVTHEDEYDAQAKFLDLWATGSYDLVHFGNKDKDRMGNAVKALEKYVPKLNRMGNLPFWEGLYWTSRKMLAKYGPAWVIRYLVEMENVGKEIFKATKDYDPAIALENGSLMAGFGGMGLELGQLTKEMFAQPLVQSLLREYDEDMDEENAEERSKRIPDDDDMWMDPQEALEMIQGTSTKYKTMKQWFTKVDWQ